MTYVRAGYQVHPTSESFRNGFEHFNGLAADMVANWLRLQRGYAPMLAVQEWRTEVKYNGMTHDCLHRSIRHSDIDAMFVAGTIISMPGGPKEPEGRTVPISDWRGSEFANGRNGPAGFASGPSLRPLSRGRRGGACVFLSVLQLIHSPGSATPGLPRPRRARKHLEKQ